MIEVKNLAKKYGKKYAVQDVSFEVKKGEITCLLGVNGAGKSTILRSIMHLSPYNAGEITIDQMKFHPKQYEKITFVPDKSTMPIHISIAQAFEFMAKFYDNWIPEKANRLLDFFQLNPKETFKNLSAGNCAKANLILGLSLKSDYIVLDEPFSGIDIFSREQIISAFTDELLEGQGVLLTTHEIQEIENLVDHVILLNKGKVAKDFYAEQVRQETGQSVVDIMREVYEKQ